MNSSGGITEPNPGAAITANALAVNAVDTVDLPQTNMVGTLAANVFGTGSTFDFVDGQGLTVGTVNTVFGVTTDNGNIVLQTTAGDLTIDGPINTLNGGFDVTLGSAQVGLISAGVISETSNGELLSPAVEAIAANGIDLTGANSILTFAGQSQNGGQSLSLADIAPSLTIDSVQVSAGALSLPTVSGAIANGPINIGIFQTGFAPAALILNQPVNANNGLTTLGASPGLVRTGFRAAVISGRRLQASSSPGSFSPKARQGCLTAANH